MLKVETLNDALDLNSVFDWSEANNMLFNSNKFQHLQYGSCRFDSCEYSSPDNEPIGIVLELRSEGSWNHDELNWFT